MNFRLISDAFQDNGAVPSMYTCEGANISPPLKWEGAPKETKSFVLIVDDPDAPGKTWTHWVLFNILATTSECKEGEVPTGALQGMNDFGHPNYGGPCPPSGTHRYFFKIYAVDQVLALSPGASKQEVETAMRSHVLQEARLIGTYRRNRS